MRKIAFLLLPIFLIGASNFERGVAYYLYGEKGIAKSAWSSYFGKRRDPIALGFLTLADGDYINASYHFNSYRKESRTAYYGKYEWMKYLGLSLAVYDIAYFQREWYAARAKEFYPSSPIVNFVQGVYDLDMGKLERSERRLRISIKKLKDPIFKFFLARLYIDKGELSKAEEIFNSTGKNFRIGEELAEAYRERGDIVKGWEIISKLPKTPKFLEKMADFAFSLGRDYAIKDIEPLFPEDSPMAKEIEAFHLINRMKYKKARKILLKLYLYRPTDPHIWKWLSMTEKKTDKKLKYMYLSFFNGGNVENVFGIQKKNLRKIEMAKWLGENRIILLGRPGGRDEYGLYSFELPSWTKKKIPLRLEIEDFFPQRDGKTLIISGVDRIRGRRIFYLWKGGEKPRKAVVLSLTDEKFKGEMQGDSIVFYSNEYDYLPFKAPFEKMVNEKRFLFLYSKEFPHRFIVYSIPKRRAKKVNSIQDLPFLPTNIEKFQTLRKIYKNTPDFRNLIKSYSHMGSEDLEIRFQGKNAVVVEKEGDKDYLQGYIFQGRWIPLKLRDGEKRFSLLLWIPEANAFLCKDKNSGGYIYTQSDGKFRKIESKVEGGAYYNDYLYFLAGDKDGKRRLYKFDISQFKKEKLTDYLWIDIWENKGKIFLKDPTTTVYTIKGGSILPVYVESDYSIEPTNSFSKVFIYSPLKRISFLVQLN